MAIKRVYRKRPEPGWYYVYDLYVAGRRIRTPRGEAFPTKQECNDAVSAIRADYRRGRYQFPADRSHVTIADLEREWTAKLKQLGRSPGYIARTKQSLERIALIEPNVASLKSHHLDRFLGARIESGAKLSTIYAETVTLMAALNNAGALFQSLEQWQPPRKPKNCVQNTEGRQRIITRGEEQRIIEALVQP